jgi:hypothetical protein
MNIHNKWFMLLRDLWFINMNDVVWIVLVRCVFLPFVQVFYTIKNGLVELN